MLTGYFSSKVFSNAISRWNVAKVQNSVRTENDDKSTYAHFGAFASFFHSLNEDYLKAMQIKARDLQLKFKEQTEVIQTKFHQTSEQKANIANEWMNKDRMMKSLISEAQENETKAKIAYLAEYISYNKNIRTAQEYVESFSDLKSTSPLSLIRSLEVQKEKLKNAELEVTKASTALKELQERRSGLSFAEKLKAVKMEHSKVSEDLHKNKSNLVSVARLVRRSDVLLDTIKESNVNNLEPWSQSFQLAKNFAHTVLFSVKFKIATSKN